MNPQSWPSCATASSRSTANTGVFVARIKKRQMLNGPRRGCVTLEPEVIPRQYPVRLRVHRARRRILFKGHNSRLVHLTAGFLQQRCRLSTQHIRMIRVRHQQFIESFTVQRLNLKHLHHLTHRWLNQHPVRDSISTRPRA